VNEKLSDRSAKRWRGLYQWLTGSSASPEATPSDSPASSPEVPERIGHFTILRKLGQGGMGVVYAARDERLGRTVAVKTMASMHDDETARQRFWREARAAASVNHPNICQIHEVGEHDGTLFIAMELLEGEALSDRLEHGPMQVDECVPVGQGMLAALSALHDRGLVHRDLKPSNVFLTPHGVKLLDFGLARPEVNGLLGVGATLTRSGALIGTPRYMAPEQANGESVDARCDVFAAGAILFEMLAGRPAFSGASVVDVLHATLHEQPPALSGSPAIAAIDRVIRRALAKRPADRFPSAKAMADELRELPDSNGASEPALAQPLTRIVVLPFRVLRPDPETDFLAFSLPDAIATSLAEVRSLVVRSTAAAARFAGETPDLKALAAEAQVDRVVMGTLLRAGDDVRATAQLVEAPAGTLLTSHTIQAPLGNLFGLQDDIARRVTDALALPLGATTTPAPEPPHNPRAYEFYLRANELARSYDKMLEARELYTRALDLDPRFAMAWAHLGRCHRVIGKYIEGTLDSWQKARDALDRALALAPRLSTAHKFYAHLEADVGQAQLGMQRLLREAARHGNDPELFAGLVHSARYCGLFDEALAAHVEARRLDPNAVTSLDQTLLTAGHMDRLLAGQRAAVDGGADEGIRIMALGLSGRREEAREALHKMRGAMRLAAFQVWADHLLAWIDRRPDVMNQHFGNIGSLMIQEDPEANFLRGWLLCDAGAHEIGLGFLQRGVDKGYFAASTLAHSPHFDPLRSNPVFKALVAQAEAGRLRALSAFKAAGGDELLGRPAAALGA
jgi:serine/threonine protein kinase/tetratricopeptide (TPR) repeat protein